MPRIVVRDDRRDVIVVVESFETRILVDTQNIPMVGKHIVVVVKLGDVVDFGGTAPPHCGKRVWPVPGRRSTSMCDQPRGCGGA